jgi:hypothetical protein
VPPVTAPLLAQTFIYSRLSADGTLRGLIPGGIHSEYAPEGTASPWVVYKQMDPGRDLTALGADAQRIKSEPLYIIEAVGKVGSYLPLDPIAARIDALLQGASGAAGDGYVSDCRRESAYSLAELVDTVDYRHLGGQYRLILGPG